MNPATEESIAASSKKRPWKEIGRQELVETLEQHRKWVEANGEEGERADLSGANLEGVDLTGANLRRALLRKANLRGADLFLADLQGACLAQANLQEANLLGTQLRGASLQGAVLSSATGLVAGQLAGADVYEALLPKPVSEFEGLKYVVRLSRNVGWTLATILSVSVLTWLFIAMTTDVQLLKDSPALPLPHIGGAMPIVEFYLVAPLLLFGFYVYLFSCLRRLWEGLAELPAVFPDGRALQNTGPWLVMALTRKQFKWLREKSSTPVFLEVGISMLLTYWVVPATLVLFWGRYLTRLDIRGTMLHIFLVVAATTAATTLPDMLTGRLHPENPEPQHSRTRSAKEKLFRRVAVVLGLGVFLSLLSVGTIFGVPHDPDREAELKGTDVRRWAAGALWLVGYDPYANLTELEVSTKPANWTGRDEELGVVRGPRLNKLRVRYAKGYRTFLVNAHLWQADFHGANLSEADLRGANLRQAIFRSALLDHARINRASLEGADLRGANLARADLRDTDLSYASLADVMLIDAKLSGANLYGANLQAAFLLRAKLDRADLREANLENANLAFADLREAYLWSAKLPGAHLREAQLGRAVLMEAELRAADLRGADLQGAILRGANLTGANLEGADLRGAMGLSAAQVCSAMVKREIKLDESLQLQVENQCGIIPQAPR